MENEDAEARHLKAAEESADLALMAMTDLIVYTLKGPSDGRFAEAKRLIEVAQSLVRARAKRAADFQGDDDWKGRDQNQYIHAVRNALNQVPVAGGGGVNFAGGIITTANTMTATNFTTNTAATYNILTTAINA